MRLYKVLALCALVSFTPACSTVASLATSFSSSSVSQVNTLADALQAASVITVAVDTYVNSAKVDKGTLIELQSLSNGTHTALNDLEAANAAGKSLNFAAFNATLDAYNAYAATKGI